MTGRKRNKPSAHELALAASAAIFLIIGFFAYAQASPKATPTPVRTVAARLSGREWLDANKGAPDFALRLVQYARDEAKAESALALLTDYYPLISDAAGRKISAALAGRYAELLARYQRAAEWYKKAAKAETSGIDPDMSLRAAYCLMAIGEFQAADPLIAEASSAVSSYAPEGNLSAAIRLRAKAQMARFWLSLFSINTQGLEKDVLGFIQEGENAGSRAEGLLILAMLDKSRSSGGAWKASDSDYGKKILSDFPGSPEASILKAASGVPGDASHTILRLSESPLWLLNGFLVRGPDSAFKAVNAGPSPAAKVSPSPAADALASSGQKITAYQIGSFAQRKNAESLVAELRSKSFNVSLREKKNSKGQTLYAVVVSAGSDANSTDLKLKEAGFESLPLFE
jgi:tetratricopeptide (TPR) repeat protein